MTERVGRAMLVGAGPGDPELITLRGAKAIGRADVILFDELATDELLGLARDDARLINVGKRGHALPTRSQEEINRLIVKEALAGACVVRLKGGDPFVFGRGGEEATACANAGVPFEIVPGVTSAIAAPAYAGIPVTDRRYSASFAVVTGHKDPSGAAERTRWRELAKAVDTLIILMGMRNLPTLLEEIMAGGLAPDTPAAAVMQGTLPSQRTCVSTLERLAMDVAAEGLGAPSAVVIGGVVDLRLGMSWWERQPLFGRRVLVTRARDQSAEMASALRAVGAEPVIRPMIELVASEEAAVRDEVDGALAQLAEYQALVFTSSNAVRFFARARMERSPDTRARHRNAGKTDTANTPEALNAQVFCVGEQTAAAAVSAGLPVHVVASGRSDAEALLAQILQNLPGAGERVLIPRSRIGRTVIAEGLAAAGARVDSIPFYENRAPDFDPEELRSMLIENELAALTFTSPSTVDHFWAGLDDESRDAARRCTIAAIGRTTARRLAEVGLPATVVPDRPSAEDLVAALVQAFED